MYQVHMCFQLKMENLWLNRFHITGQLERMNPVSRVHPLLVVVWIAGKHVAELAVGVQHVGAAHWSVARRRRPKPADAPQLQGAHPQRRAQVSDTAAHWLQDTEAEVIHEGGSLRLGNWESCPLVNWRAVMVTWHRERQREGDIEMERENT